MRTNGKTLWISLIKTHNKSIICTPSVPDTLTLAGY